MKELSIEQKQEIYEYLLTFDYPDLLAALIAERSEETLAWHEVMHDGEYPLTVSSLISGAFLWDETPEGVDFWGEITREIEEIEEGTVTQAQITPEVEWDYTVLLSEIEEELTDCNQVPDEAPVVRGKLLSTEQLIGVVILIGVIIAGVFKYTGVI